MKIFIEEWIYFVVIAVIVTCGWQGLEILMIGRINPNHVDSIIGFILTVSLYGNLKMWKKVRK